MKIFVSSNQIELEEERRRVKDIIKNNPVLDKLCEVFTFEDLPAQTGKAGIICLKTAAESDVYIGIIGNEYGGVRDNNGLSATEREFDAFFSRHNQGDAYVFIKGKEESKRDEGTLNFIEKVKGKCIYRNFENIYDLQTQVLNSLIVCLYEKHLLSETSFNQEKEVLELREYIWSELRRVAEKELREELENSEYIKPNIKEKKFISPDAIWYSDPSIKEKSEKEQQGTKVQVIIEIDVNKYFVSGRDRKIAIVADSGIGKTTFLKWLFNEIVQGNIQTDLLPFYLPPTASPNFATKEKLVDLICSYFNAPLEGCKSFIRNEIEQGNCLFLVDSLDQMGTTGAVTQGLQTGFGRNIVVLTSRHGREEYFSRNKFTELKLEEFDLSQTDAYLGNLKEHPVVKAISDPNILKVPILLKMIKSVLGKKDILKIETKSDLYKEFINQILKREQRLQEGRQKCSIDYREIHNYLQKLAYNSLRAGYLGQFPRGKIGKFLELEESNPATGIVIKELLDRPIVVEIMESKKDEVAFRHRSFQEYLAAERLSEILKEKKVEEIEGELFHPDWEESLKFLSGLMKDDVKKVEEIAMFLLNPPEIEKYVPLKLYKGNVQKALLWINEILPVIDKRNSVETEEIHKIISQQIKEFQKTWLGNYLYDIYLEIFSQSNNSTEIIELFIKLLKDNYWARTRVAKAIGKIKSEKAVAPLIEALEDKNKYVFQTIGYIKAFGEIKSEKAVPSLIKLLEDKDAEIRKASVEALGEIKSKEAVRSLIKLLKDKGEWIRRVSVETLGKMQSEEAVGPLIKLLKDKDAEIRKASVEALGEIKSKEAVPSLIKLLEDKEEKEWVKRTSAEALGNIKSEKAVPTLIKLLEDKSEDVRRIATVALGEMRSEKAVPSLIKLLEDKNESKWIRRTSAEALGNIKSEKAVPSIIELLEDEWGRETAVEVLGKMQSEKAVPSLIKLLENKDEEVRKITIDVLGKIKSEKAVPTLIKLLEDKGEEFFLRTKTAEVLGEIKSKEAVPSLIRLLEDKNENKWIRRFSAEVLGEIKSKEAVPLLIKLLEDKDEERWVRETAIEVLGKMQSEKAVPSLIKLLENKDEEVRETAIEALGEIKSDKAVETLIKLLEDKDEKKWTIETAVEALGEIKSDKAVETLIKLLEDKDKGVREPAIEALGKIKSENCRIQLLKFIKFHPQFVKLDIVNAIREVDESLRRKEIIPITDSNFQPEIGTKGHPAEVADLAAAVGGTKIQSASGGLKSQFPTPPGTKWEDVTIQFISDESIKISANEVSKEFHYTEIGFKDNRKGIVPDSQWKVLQYLAKCGGTISWNFEDAKEYGGYNYTIPKDEIPKPTNLKERKAFPKRIERLRKKLKTIMQLDGDPFENYIKVKSYKSKFTIILRPL
ncbi:MAG: HEAT repeat domain-containing protein [bacterium]|nr:HEAT repeat domain-containing protein [bacterium]